LIRTARDGDKAFAGRWAILLLGWFVRPVRQQEVKFAGN
jgi:hypothetical protein